MDKREEQLRAQLDSENWITRNLRIVKIAGGLAFASLLFGAHQLDKHQAVAEAVAETKESTTNEVMETLVAKGVTNELGKFLADKKKEYIEQLNGMNTGFVDNTRRELLSDMGKNGMPNTDIAKLECRGNTEKLCYNRSATTATITKMNANRTVLLFGLSPENQVVTPESVMSSLGGKACLKALNELEGAIVAATGITAGEELVFISAASTNMYESPELMCPKK